MARRPLLVAGNWKLHGTRAFATELATAIATAVTPPPGLTIACLPPTCFLAAVREALGSGPIRLGGQDLSPEAEGAFTGDVSGHMLADCGCRFVLIGHSERRQNHGEHNPLLSRKLRRAFEAGLHPILCVGEPDAVRRRGAELAYVEDQVEGLLYAIAADDVPPFSVAYEPLWAIGTGNAATPAQAQSMCAAVRAKLADLAEHWRGVSVLYGGSVGPETAAALAREDDVDGFLVGSASLSANSFAAIVDATIMAHGLSAD